MEKTLSLKDELIHFRNHTQVETAPISRELQKFLTEYKTGHWEAALLYVGRAIESLIFSTARRLNLSIYQPRIKSLDKIDRAHKSILESAKTMISSMESDEKLKLKIVEQTKNLATAAHDIQFELDEMLNSKIIVNSKSLDFGYALKQIETHIAKEQGNKSHKAFCNQISTPIREIMKIRDGTAHADREGKRKTHRKNDVLKSHNVLLRVTSQLKKFL